MKKYLFLLLSLAGCIKTEIVPETVAPRLMLEFDQISLIVGQEKEVSYTYTDSLGNSLPELVEWRSSNNTIVQVEPDGTMKGISSGQAWAIASVPGVVSDSVRVTVIPDPNAVSQVLIAAEKTTLLTGETTTLVISIFNGAGQSVGNLPVQWKSSNPNVLTISAGGVVEAVAPGSAEVTASVQGVESLPLSMVVMPAGGLVRTGTFSGNSGYNVSGSATLRQTPSGIVLEFGSDFSASAGVTVGIYLAKTPSGALNGSNSFSLGLIQKQSGAQTYTVPAGIGFSEYDYAVVYCIPFNVRFGTAKLN